MFGWILVLIGLVYGIFGIGVSAKAQIDAKGLTVTASPSIILIIVGVWFMSMGL